MRLRILLTWLVAFCGVTAYLATAAHIVTASEPPADSAESPTDTEATVKALGDAATATSEAATAASECAAATQQALALVQAALANKGMPMPEGFPPQLVVPIPDRSVAGEYTCHSEKKNYVGRVTISPMEGGKSTYEMTWEALELDAYSGVGILRGNVLAAGGFGGVTLFDVSFDQQGHPVVLRGQSIALDAGTESHDEVLRYIGPVREEAIEGDIVAANYTDADGDDTYWYYAKVLKKKGDVYLVKALFDGDEQTLGAKEVSKHRIGVGDEVVQGYVDDDWWEMSITAVTGVKIRLTEDDEVTFLDDNKELTLPLKYVRFYHPEE